MWEFDHFVYHLPQFQKLICIYCHLFTFLSKAVKGTLLIHSQLLQCWTIAFKNFETIFYYHQLSMARKGAITRLSGLLFYVSFLRFFIFWLWTKFNKSLHFLTINNNNDNHRLIIVASGTPDVTELDRIAGGVGKSLTSNTFEQKMKDKDFLREIAGDFCVPGLYTYQFGKWPYFLAIKKITTPVIKTDRKEFWTYKKMVQKMSWPESEP